MTIKEAQKILDKMVKRSGFKIMGNPKIRSIKYTDQDLFTIAIVNSKYIGVTKFNPNDEVFSPHIGQAKATHRALGELLEAYIETSTSRRRSAKSRG